METRQETKEINFLIGIPSPRDIPSVMAAMEEINFIDKFYAKYMPEYKAYPAIQQYFLDNDYDYLILWADDLMVTQKDFMQLIADVHERPYEMIGGICQIDNFNFKHVMAVSRYPVYPHRIDRFRSFEKFADYFKNGELLPKYKDKPIIKTKWQGFPLSCINRSVLKDIPFRNDSSWNNIPIEQGCCTDDAFCWDCIQNEVDMYTDLRINMDHLRANENSYKLIRWTKDPYTKFVKKTRNLRIDTYQPLTLK